MATTQTRRILILAKTYPSPSSKYSETSCVAGIDENGRPIRLYPVPFRLISNEQQFRKWQWITVRIQKAPKDHRPESNKLFVDTIERDPEPISTKNNWSARRDQLSRLPAYSDFEQLELERQKKKATLGILRPASIKRLTITPVSDPNWTEAELQKLLKYQQQVGLFDDTDEKAIRTLRKLPFDFHYEYECNSASLGLAEYRHKIVDWEVGALFWRCFDTYGINWEKQFRDKIEIELPTKDLMFLMGTIHRFPDKWLIVSLIYPPRELPKPITLDLFD
ncbi:hypothetical protein ACTJJ7_15915 [Phyllobacterium sp. 22229]|uniref:hypothetical protein n=1 Tax=Phyllobacterium sp. 22229 TaxID=3453895 RepID=UPI003F824348